MKNKWAKYYILIGTLLVAVIVLSSSLLLVKSNMQRAQEKHSFESFYEDTEFDFKVPSPSYDQVYQEIQDPNNGIRVMIPYFNTTQELEINGREVESEVQLFLDSAKMDDTPYCSRRIIDGSDEFSGGEVIVDQTYALNNDCNIGDTVILEISGIEIEYEITCVSENNPEYDSGVIVLVLTDDDAQRLLDEELTYTAAYVTASDYDVCRDYLMTQYKPYGRLKDPSSFSSEEVYNRHLNDFMDADWSKEITDYSANYRSLKVKYENVDSSIMRNQIIVACLISLLIVIYNIVLLANKPLKKIMQIFIVKKNGTAAKCKSFFGSGIIYMLIVYIVASGLLYYWISLGITKPWTISYLLNFIIPVVAALFVSVIMLAISRIVINVRFSEKVIKALKEEEKKKAMELGTVSSQDMNG